MGAAAIPMDDSNRQSRGGGEEAKFYGFTVGVSGGGSGGAGGQGQRLHDAQATEAERTYTTFQHLIGLVSALDGVGFLGLIGTIIMWRIKANESPFYDDHGREAVNFQISLLLYLFVGGIVLGLFTLVTLGIGAVLAAPLMILGTIFLIVIRFVGCIRGAVAANRGEYFRYPMCLRFLV